jgi:hypothetical protein
LQFASPEFRKDQDVVLVAVCNRGLALKYASPELREDKIFLIKCYRINKDTINYNNFIKQFDKLEKREYNDTFIEENVEILHFLENKQQLYEYLLQNKKYDIIYQNEEISEYIKDNYNILIQSLNDLNIEKEYDNDKLKEKFRSDNQKYNVMFI